MRHLDKILLSSIVCGCIGGCGPVLYGSRNALGLPSVSPHHTVDKVKADSEMTCVELQSDLSDIDADLTAVNSRMAQYGENSSTKSTNSAPGGTAVASSQAPEITKLRAQRDAYQQRRDALSSVYRAKGCKSPN
jgi:hypothetical protein